MSSVCELFTAIMVYKYSPQELCDATLNRAVYLSPSFSPK